MPWSDRRKQFPKDKEDRREEEDRARRSELVRQEDDTSRLVRRGRYEQTEDIRSSSLLSLLLWLLLIGVLVLWSKKSGWHQLLLGGRTLRMTPNPLRLSEVREVRDVSDVKRDREVLNPPSEIFREVKPVSKERCGKDCPVRRDWDRSRKVRRERQGRSAVQSKEDSLAVRLVSEWQML